MATLSAIASRYSVSLEAIATVPDVKVWCDEHGVDDSNHWRVAITVRNSVTGLPRIVLADEITPIMQNRVLSGLEARGHDVEQLRDPGAFLVHLFLHELAHAQFPSASERECDEWAFSKLADNDG